MIEEIFKTNIESLKQNYHQLYNKIVSIEIKKERKVSSVVCQKARNGMLNLKLKRDGREFLLHSSYNPLKEAENWVSRINMKGFDTIVVLGIGLGYHVEKLIDMYPDKNKIIVEPNFDVFLQLLKARDVSNIINAKNLLLIINDNFEDMAKYLLGLRQEGQIDNVLFDSLLSYRTLYDNWWYNFKKSFIKFSRLHQINTNTGVVFAKDWVTNFLKNLNQFSKSVRLDKYASEFKNIPAIIVSAGPSLDKNVHLLKEVNNRALIISAGSAINILENRGVKPHIMVGVDGGEGESKIFNSVKADGIYFAYSPTIHYEGLHNYTGPKLYFALTSLGYIRWFEREIGVNTQHIRSGSSVSNVSVDIANLLGCNPIILVGQDLSYPNQKSYAEGAILKSEQDKIINRSVKTGNKNYILQKDIYGNDVYTTQSMISIKMYFEEYVKENLERVYLNGTEGGLPIEGIKNKSLREIIDQYCRTEYNIKGILDSVYNREKRHEEDREEVINSFLLKVNKQSNEIKEKAIKRINILLDILGNIDSYESCKKWEQIESITEEIESFDLFKNFVKPVCQLFLQAVKNERERRAELIEDIREKKRFLYEGLLMQYIEVKDKIALISSLSDEIINNNSYREEF